MIAPAPRLLAHRWFFALKPDEVTARRTRAFAEEQLGEKGLLRPEHHHVTLALTEDFESEPAGLVDALLRAGADVAAAPFELILDKLVGSHRSVALRPRHALPSLRDLQKEIAGAMTWHGAAIREDWAFSPHQTLCYRPGTPFDRPVTPFRWTVEEFVLVHSFVGLSRHETIGRWALRPVEDPQGTLL